MLAVALSTGRHVVLEGPPGTGKSTLLRAVTVAAGLGLELVEGHAELTPSRLVGAHDPAAVLDAGYSPEAFVPGPLVRAVRDGSVLYVEELNRVPDETLNVLITALAEGEVHVPRAGRFVAAPSFRLVAAMNPFDAVGTARVAQALYDRLCRIVVDYLDADGETRIVMPDAGGDRRLAAAAVALVRATRTHPDLRHGSSVRGAKDVAALVRGLTAARREVVPSRATVRQAVHASLSGRVRVDDGCERTAEEVLDELLDEHWPDEPDDDPGRSDDTGPPDGPHEPDDTGRPDSGDPDGPDDADAPDGPAPEEPDQPANEPEEDQAGGEVEDQAGTAPPPADVNRGTNHGHVSRGHQARDAVTEAGRRRQPRTQLARAHARLEQVSPEVGHLDEQAMSDLLAEDAEAGLALLVDLLGAVDPVLRARARRLAGRLAVGVGRTAAARRRGVGRVVARTGTDEGELDLDASIERARGRPRGVEDLVVRSFAAPDVAIVLCVDRSGSMRGQQVLVAAATTAAVLLAADGHARTGVVAFSTDAVVLAGTDDDRPVEQVVDDVLTLRGHGATDLSVALRTAAQELAGVDRARRVAIVLSDALATAGDDPLRCLGGLDTVHVVGTSTSPASVEAGRALARASGGQHRVATDLEGVVRALRPLLT